jgi:hypothetical protein
MPKSRPTCVRLVPSGSSLPVPIALVALLLVGGVRAQNAGLDWLRFVGGPADEDAGWPNGLHVGPSGDVWLSGSDGTVAPAGALVVQVSSAGQTLASWSIPGNGITRANAIATDPSGSLVYVAGRTTATDHPVAGNAVQVASAGGRDMFLSVYTASGSLVYSTYLGGTADEVVTDLEVDGQGRVWLYGATASADFPVTGNAYQAIYGGVSDLVVCCIDLQTPVLVYSTFLGGAADDYPSDMCLHASGVVSLAGYTGGALPVTATALQPTYGGGTFDGFFVRLDPAASGSAQLLYCTYFGGNDQDNGNALDVQGDLVTMGGWSRSTNLPTGQPGLPPAVQASKNLLNDAYMVQFDAAGSGPGALRYCTYVGGSRDEGVNDLVVDAGGMVTIIGNGGSLDFPTTPGAWQTGSNVALARSYVTKIDPVAGRLLYSTVLVDASGPTNALVARGDGYGGVYALGRTQAASLPVTMPPALAGGWDLYLAHWNLLPLGAERWGVATPSAAGPSFMSVTAQPRMGAVNFEITAGGVPTGCPSTLGILLAGPGPSHATLPLPPFGTLWLAQPWLTAGIVLTQGAPRASWPLSLGGVPVGTFAAFEFVWFEPCTSALSASNALEITVR